MIITKYTIELENLMISLRYSGYEVELIQNDINKTCYLRAEKNLVEKMKYLIVFPVNEN